MVLLAAPRSEAIASRKSSIQRGARALISALSGFPRSPSSPCGCTCTLFASAKQADIDQPDHAAGQDDEADQRRHGGSPRQSRGARRSCPGLPRAGRRLRETFSVTGASRRWRRSPRVRGAGRRGWPGRARPGREVASCASFFHRETSPLPLARSSSVIHPLHRRTAAPASPRAAVRRGRGGGRRAA